MTVPKQRTTAELAIRAHILAINLGYCCWCGTRTATNGCHRLPEGQGGPYITANLLPGCGSGTTGCHAATERARALSYRCGWLLPQDTNPEGRSARIAAVPALVRTQLAPTGAWHLLDFIDPATGRPAGLASLADPAEVLAAGLDPALTLPVALAQLRARRAGAA